jgi:hypothetical protein
MAHIETTLYDKQNSDEVLDRTTLPYVRYKRFRTGLAEACAFFIWDKLSFTDMSMHILIDHTVRFITTVMYISANRICRANRQVIDMICYVKYIYICSQQLNTW